MKAMRVLMVPTFTCREELVMGASRHPGDAVLEEAFAAAVPDGHGGWGRRKRR
jgi:hypothetical protein